MYLLAALSSDTRSTPVKPSAERLRLAACSVVTRSDVKQVLGRAVARGTEESSSLGSTCDYETGQGLVSVTVQHLTATPDRSVEIAGLAKEIPEGVVRDAPEFGPDAFFLDIPGAGAQLHIVRGGREHLMVSVLGLGEPPEASAVAARIRRKALTRLSGRLARGLLYYWQEVCMR